MKVTLYGFAFLHFAFNVSSFFLYESISLFFSLFFDLSRDTHLCWIEKRRSHYLSMNPTKVLPHIKPFSLRSSLFAFTPEGRKWEEGKRATSPREKIRSPRDHLERVQSRKSPRDGPTRLRPLLTAVAITKGWLRQEFVLLLNAYTGSFSARLHYDSYARWCNNSFYVKRWHARGKFICIYTFSNKNVTFFLQLRYIISKDEYFYR